jgi:thiamine-phosphate pyrophosphorylase
MHLSKFKVYHFINEFNKKDILKIDKNINLIFRNYDKKLSLFFLKELKCFCHKNGYKIYLSNNVDLANILGFDGVYLPSFNKNLLKKKKLKKNFETLGSAHNLHEIKIKEKQGVEKIFLSPLFDTKSKKGLGIYKFRKLSQLTKKTIVPLGGINNSNIKKLILLKKSLLASINYINNKYGIRQKNTN